MNIESFQKLAQPAGEALVTGFAYVVGAATDNLVIHELGTSIDLKLVLGMGAGVFLIGRWMQRQTDDIKAIKKQIEDLSRSVEGLNKEKKKR